jgi:ubiquinone biosynthesis accessory factor UbiJ
MAVTGQHQNDAPAAVAAVERLGALVEGPLNRLVGESTAAGRLLERLAGQSFAVHVEGLGLAIALHAESERLRVDGDTAGATASVRATPLDLLRLVNAGGVTGVRRTNAVLSGDLDVAERFGELLKLARPDLEGEVARLVGDIPAHALGEVARGARNWAERAAAALRMNTAEYLQEEQRVLPTVAEAQAFFAGVERLRDDVERAAARLVLLERR